MPIDIVITELPVAPDPAADTPQAFSEKAAAMVLAQKNMPPQLNTFASQANALAVDVNAKSVAATSAAQIAAAAATDAASAAGVEAWVSGKSYPKNAATISQVNFQTYRRRAAGTTTVDPANDSTNWVMLTGDGAFIPQPVSASGLIDLSRGNYHTRTMLSNGTFTFDNCPSDGFSFTFELTVTAGVATFPTSVRTPDDVPYTLTAGKVHELMFVTSNRGARWRLAAATNYAI